MKLFTSSLIGICRRTYGLRAALAVLSLTAISAHADTVTWVGPSGSTSIVLTTASGWSNNAVPSAGNDYVVDGTTTIYTNNAITSFGGDSLTFENGATLELYHSTGTYTVTIPNLTIDNATLLDADNANSDEVTVTLAGGITFSGTDTVTWANGAFTNTLFLNGNVSGDGTVNLVGTTANGHNRPLTLTSSANASGFTGNWSLTGVNATNLTVLTIQTTTGWGSGNITLNGNATLTLSVGTTALTATSSDISLTTTDTFAIGSGTTTIGGLSFGGTNAAAGSYAATDLNTLFDTSAFSGAGLLIVVPEASTVALTVIFGTGMLLLFRRRSLSYR